MIKIILLFVFLSIFFTAFSFNKKAADNSLEKTERISALQAKQLIVENKDNKDFVVLDIRTQDEYKSGHIERAVWIDYYQPDFEKKINELDKEKIYLVYCRSGNRSGKAFEIFKQLNFKKVYELKSGIIDWINEKYELVYSNEILKNS